MYSKFLKYIHEQELFGRSDKLLLGVSGGVDSVVLANLVNRLGNEFALAHCNFNLRGDASDGDEKFVDALASDLGVKCFFSSFQTREYAAEKGISIEMAARDLRYEWFEQLCFAKGYDWILVAHHLDDVLETFILNMSRGTGIRGLSGIKSKAGKVVRPLLFATREEIEAYAEKSGIESRHDASNDDTAIKRNKVRHDILPQLCELNPAFKRNLQQTISYLNDTELIYLEQINQVREQLISASDNWVKIDKEGLRQLHPLNSYLYELLRPFKFNSDVVAEIAASLDGISGSQFYSSSHRLVVDRGELIITKLESENQDLYYIEKGKKFIREPLHLHLTLQRYNPEFVIPRTSDIAVLDYDKLRFPLMLRKWQQGEYFRPLGMTGFKKLSDFFIDEKLSIPEKESTWILASDNKVVWVVGRRIDDRFKITTETKLVLRIEIMKTTND